MKRGIIKTAAALTICLAPIGGVLLLPSVGASEVASGVPVRTSTTRQVQIDGRLVRVEVQILRTIGGAPNPQGNTPVTSVLVNVSINDGALLPNGLRAVGVRFEKLRGIRRFFFTPLFSTNSPEPLFEQDIRSYQGDLSDRPEVRFLNATVRLEYNGQIIKVPMGTLPVNLLPLP